MADGSWLDVVQTGAVVIASGVAIYGIDAWKREHVGKRRIELAEEVLAMFYEARDAIHDVRAPFSFGGEGATRPPGENETSERKKALDSAYVTIERLKRHTELFSKLYSARYRFMASFGEPAGKPFYDLNERIHELNTTAWMYADHLTTPPYALNTEEQIQFHNAEGQRLRRVLYKIALNAEDEFGSNVDKIVTTIDKTCRAVIASNGSK